MCYTSFRFLNKTVKELQNIFGNVNNWQVVYMIIPVPNSIHRRTEEMCVILSSVAGRVSFGKNGSGTMM